ncbi:MAG: hypothetical protein SFU56_22830 [Capsulimonadales bacterium]|nr:hypothetical protein [Capsulimonadales bacterium]
MKTTTGRRTAAMLTATGFLLLSLPGMAQTPTTIPTSQAEFEKQVGITADQKKRMDALNKKYQPQFAKIQNKYKPDFDKLQQQMQALQQKAMTLRQKMQTEANPLQQQMQKEADSILTPAQREKIKQINAAMQQQRSAMQGAGGGLPGQP